MGGPVQPVPLVEEEINLYPEWRTHEGTLRTWRARAVSVGLHLVVVLLLGYTPLGRGPRHDVNRIVAQWREPIKLVAPPRELTQTSPNRGKVGKEFDLDSLLPRPRVFVPPSLPPGAPPSGRPAPLPEPPKIEVAEQSRTLGLDLGSVVPPAPQPPPVDKPKLAFESLPALRGPEPGKSTLPPARSGAAPVSEMAAEIARRGPSGLIVSDFGDGAGGAGLGLNVPPSTGRVGNSLELLSDPKGVDFRPYLVRVLAAVKRNWLAVIPESAKLGTRGRVVLQFSVSRDGKVPKLVIASASGSEALDRAAVAGVSATTPFPPLPADYFGPDIRLQFVFLYNLR